MDSPPHDTPQDRSAQEDTEQRLRLVLDSLPEHAVFLISLTGQIESWNSGVQRVLGYRQPEFIGLPFSALFTPEDRAQNRAAQELDRARTTGRSDDKREHVRRDGTRFHADGVVTVMRSPEGAPIAFSKVMHDATLQHEATDALRVSEERYRSLVDSVGDHAIFMLDVTGHIASWTPTAERLMGYSKDYIIGKHFSIFFSDEDRQRRVPEQELRTGEETGSARSEGWRVRVDGSRFWAEEILSPIRGSAGELRGFAKVVRDLTERQRAALEREQLLTQAQEANRLKDEFLGTVSHELRTPLNAILGWTQLLESDDAIGLDAARRQRALATIRRNALMQAQLVDDLLDVSRIIAGKIRLDIQPTSLLQILSQTVESLQPTAAAKNVSLELAQADDHVILVDPERLQQIVWNLVSNAIKFTAADGHVSVESRVSDRGTDIIVDDTGSGIPADVLPFVFERFRQADSSTKRSHGGVGLGLAIVRHLVELHGGTVVAASPGAGLGSTFTVHLPVSRAVRSRGASKRSMLPGRPDDAPSLVDVKVLLVDDDTETQEVLTTFFQRAGAQVTVAESAAQGITRLEQDTPDVIIADIGMPREDGYTFITKVRTRPGPDSATPSIALTAYARREDQERALSAGFQRHIAKPTDPLVVLNAVAELVASR